MNKLSFCMTTYNKQELLRLTLDNYLANKKPYYEIIISDGCSSDGTVPYLKRLYTDKLIDSLILSPERDKGEWEGFKKTLANVTGDYVYFLTDDDYFHFPSIDRIFMLLCANPEIDYLIADGLDLRFNTIEHLNYHRVFKMANSIKPEKNGLRDGTCGLGLFVKRELTEKLELFSPKYGKRADKTITLELMNSDYVGASCSLPTYVGIKNEKSNSYLYNYDFQYIEKQEVLIDEPNKNFTANTEEFQKRFELAPMYINKITVPEEVTVFRTQ